MEERFKSIGIYDDKTKITHLTNDANEARVEPIIIDKFEQCMY